MCEIQREREREWNSAAVLMLSSYYLALVFQHRVEPIHGCGAVERLGELGTGAFSGILLKCFVTFALAEQGSRWHFLGKISEVMDAVARVLVSA